MRKWSLRILRTAYIGLIAFLPVAAMANYAATVGSGTNFGSVVIGGVHFMSNLICDMTTANQCAAVSAGGAVKVDGSAVTQPISAASNVPVSQATAASLNATVVGTGTFATQLTGATNNINNIAGTISLPTGASTAALQPTNAAQGSTTSGQTGPLVQCSVTTAAPTYTTAQTDPLNCDTGGNLRVNVMAGPPGLAQGSTTSGQTGSMIMGAVTTAAPTNTTGQTAYASLATTGGLRIAGDGTKLLVTPDSVALPSNQSVNVNQIGGTGVIADPCQAIAKTYTPISITTATTTRIIAPTAAKKTYICNMYLFANGADNVAIVEGTGGTCGTGTAGVLGGTTAANGLNLLANEGSNMGVGSSAVLATAGTNVDFCLITSAAISLAGHVAWVQQ